MSGAVSGVSVACPVSELTGAQSALASSVSGGVSAKPVVSQEVSIVMRQSPSGSHAPTVGTRVSAVVVGSVVLGNSAQVSSVSALISRVSNASSGVSASTAPTRTALSIVSSTAVQSSAAS